MVNKNMQDPLWQGMIKQRWPRQFPEDCKAFSEKNVNWKFAYISRHLSSRLHTAILTVKPPYKADMKICGKLLACAPDVNMLVHSDISQPEVFTWIDKQVISRAT